MHKILTNLYPNPGFNPEEIHFDERFERILVRPKHNPSAEPWVERLRTASFFTKGPKLYQTVLPYLGGVDQLKEPTEDNLKEFKKKLDEFLETIPDEPGYPEGRRARTNSVLDQVRYKSNI